MKDNDFDETTAFERCIEFLNYIGIETTFRKIGNKSFLPGLSCMLFMIGAWNY